MRPLATNDAVALVFVDPPFRRTSPRKRTKAELGQIVRNLISGALKFTEVGAKCAFRLN